LWAAGFSHGNTDTTYADIDFAFRVNGGGWADVIENGVYQGGDTPYTTGDTFRVAIVGGRVEYSRNGVVLHDSPNAPQYPLLLDASLATVGATVANARIGVPDPPPPYGGFLEKAGSQTFRGRFTREQIQAFLPGNDAKGPFKFPAPYGTTGVRLTNGTDCGGTDCLSYVGYSYWRNINNHVGRPEIKASCTKLNGNSPCPQSVRQLSIKAGSISLYLSAVLSLLPSSSPWYQTTPRIAKGWSGLIFAR